MLNTNYIFTSYGNFISEAELYHWEIKGMKWGVRRYQNEDGTLTPAGRKRIEKKDQKWAKKRKQRRSLPKQRKLLRESSMLMVRSI